MFSKAYDNKERRDIIPKKEYHPNQNSPAASTKVNIWGARKR
jgi:hypothetical protein